MLDALTDREDVCIRGYEMVVDMNATSDRQSRIARELHIGPNADRHDDQTRRNLATVL